MPDLILLLICVWVDLPGEKRNRTGGFRDEISPEELTVAVPSLEEEAWSAKSVSGPENRHLPAFPSATTVHSSALSAQSWIVQERLLQLSQTYEEVLGDVSSMFSSQEGLSSAT